MKIPLIQFAGMNLHTVALKTLCRACLMMTLLSVTTFIKAQDDYMNEVSIDIGLHAALTGGVNPNLTGIRYDFQYAHFFVEKYGGTFGARSGFNLINMDNNTRQYQIPLYAAFSGEIKSVSTSYYETRSLNGLFFDLLLLLIPKRIELNIGPSFGWISASNDTRQEIYRLNQRFAVSLDAQCRLTFRIWRFGLVGTIGASYSPVNNFELRKDNYHPHWFCKATGGLLFRF